MSNGFNFLDPMNRSTYLEANYPSTYQEAVEYGETLLAPKPNPNGPKLKPQIQKDGYYKQDGNDDGHISTFEKIKAFVKGGTYNMVKGLFCDKDGFSIKRTLTTAAIGTAIGLTGPIGMAAAGGIGLLAGLGHFFSSASKAKHATTDQQAREAYEGIGEGTSTIGLSLFGGLKGFKAIKKNFSFAKNNPNLQVNTTDKFIKWDASKHAKPITKNETITEEPTSATVKPKRTTSKKTVAKTPKNPRKTTPKKPKVPVLKGTDLTKKLDTTIIPEVAERFNSPYQPSNTFPNPIGEASHFFG